jgi:hypothetical protein
LNDESCGLAGDDEPSLLLTIESERWRPGAGVCARPAKHAKQHGKKLYDSPMHVHRHEKTSHKMLAPNNAQRNDSRAFPAGKEKEKKKERMARNHTRFAENRNMLR